MGGGVESAKGEGLQWFFSTIADLRGGGEVCYITPEPWSFFCKKHTSSCGICVFDSKLHVCVQFYLDMRIGL